MQSHIKNKVKKKVIKTPLFDVDKTVGTQANPLNLEFGVCLLNRHRRS